jgi:serine/threonine-protein kinase HipA
VSIEALIRQHIGLHRKGPGGDAHTLRAFSACAGLPPEPVVVDLGCGSGAATLVLARQLGSPVLGVDLCQPFLDELEERARAEGLEHLVRTRCADFGELDLPPGSVDLVWSEGAIYQLGFEEGLWRWRTHVKPGGYLAVTDAVWLTPAPPVEARERWATWYPAMTTLDACRDAAARLGLDVVDAFPLPRSAWEAYYHPLVAHSEAFRSDPDPGMQAALADLALELDTFERFGDSYGYGFLVMRKRGDAPG